MKRKILFLGKGLLPTIMLVLGACTNSLTEEPQIKNEAKNEIRTLVFGLQQNNQTRSSVALVSDGTAKIAWNEGDKIVASKGDKRYIYKLKSTELDGKGIFEAVGAGIPDLADNTENIGFYHLGTEGYYNNDYSGLNMMSRTQNGNDNSNHLKENTVLELVTTTAPKSAKDLGGTLKPVTTLLSFNIASPGGLAEGELPTDVILTLKSASAYFWNGASMLNNGSLGCEETSRSKKMAVHLNNITAWNESNPLKAHFNVIIEGQANTDEWILEVQTNKGKLWYHNFTASKVLARGTRYVTDINSLTEGTLPVTTSSASCNNPLSATLYGTYDADSSTSCTTLGTDYIRCVYSSIQCATDESFNNIVEYYYVEGGKGGGGKVPEGAIFNGEGFIIVQNLSPNNTYYYRACVELEDGNVIYYGETKSFTTPDISLITTGEVDLGLSVKWSATNLGATNYYDRGCYYAWGETSEQTNEENAYTQTNYKWYSDGSYSLNCISDGKLTQTYDAAYQSTSGQWRMPTYSEIESLLSLEKIKTTENGMKGYIFVSKTPNANSKFNAMFLPETGYKKSGLNVIEGTNNSYEAGNIFYWSSTLDTKTADNSHVKVLRITVSNWSNIAGWLTSTWGGSALREIGMPIRPVKVSAE